MARRRFRGDEPRAIHQARQEARAGIDRRAIETDLAIEFPELPESRRRAIAALETERAERLERMSDTNWGQFQDMSSVLNCRPDQTQARVSLTIHWTDPLTGVAMRFGDTVVVDQGRRVGDLLTNAMKAVMSKAIDFRYQPTMPDRVNRGNLDRISIGFVDCA